MSWVYLRSQLLHCDSDVTSRRRAQSSHHILLWIVAALPMLRADKATEASRLEERGWFDLVCSTAKRISTGHLQGCSERYVSNFLGSEFSPQFQRITPTEKYCTAFFGQHFMFLTQSAFQSPHTTRLDPLVGNGTARSTKYFERRPDASPGLDSGKSRT